MFQARNKILWSLVLGLSTLALGSCNFSSEKSAGTEGSNAPRTTPTPLASESSPKPIPNFRNQKPYTFKADKSSYTILAFGDFGTGNGLLTDHQSIVARAMTETCTQMHCDFAIGLGDNFYQSGVPSAEDSAFYYKFELPYKDLKFPMFMSLGNHDYYGNIEAQIEYRSSRWALPARYYPVEGLPDWLKIYAVDSNRIDSKQVKEVRKSMCPGSGWKILYGHHPLFSNCGHGDNPEVIEKFLPVIEDCGIQAYFAGHDHNFESLSVNSFEQVISGSSSDSGGYINEEQRPGIVQNFVSGKLGFTIIQVNPKAMVYTFFESDNEGHAKPIFKRSLTRQASRSFRK